MARAGYYAVANGRRIGVFRTWDECRILVDGFPNARFKKFPSEREAHNFISDYKRSSSSSGMQTINAAYQQPCQSATNDEQFSSVVLSTGKHQTSMAKSSHEEVKNVNEIGGNRKRKQNMGISLCCKSMKEDDCALWDGAPVVYTDGACSRNGRSGAKAGYGVFWGPNHVDNQCGPVSGAATNNRGELQAVTVALNQAIEKKISHIVLRSDSELLIKSVNHYMDKWKKNNWKTSLGGDVKNQDLLNIIDNQLHHVKVKFEHVPAHCGIMGNEAADALARQGAQLYRSNIKN